VDKGVLARSTEAEAWSGPITCMWCRG